MAKARSNLTLTGMRRPGNSRHEHQACANAAKQHEDGQNRIRAERRHEIAPSDFISTPRAISRCDRPARSGRGDRRPCEHRPRLRRRDEDEMMALIHRSRTALEASRPKSSTIAGSRSNSRPRPWRRVQALMESEIPPAAETQHLQRAAVQKIAAYLLRHAHAHMFGDLLGAARMRRNFGDGLEDEMQIADRDPLGEQQLQHRLQPGIGDLRGTHIVDQALVSGPSRSAARAYPCKTEAAPDCCE